MNVRMHVCMYACMYVCMYACMYVYMYVCMYACIYVCMYICMYVCTCMYVCMNVCSYVCIFHLGLSCRVDQQESKTTRASSILTERLESAKRRRKSHDVGVTSAETSSSRSFVRNN